MISVEQLVAEVKGWTVAGIAAAVGLFTYGALELLAPHRHHEAKLEGLIPLDAVFGDRPASTPPAASRSLIAAAPVTAAAPPKAEPPPPKAAAAEIRKPVPAAVASAVAPAPTPTAAPAAAPPAKPAAPVAKPAPAVAAVAPAKMPAKPAAKPAVETKPVATAPKPAVPAAVAAVSSPAATAAPQPATPPPPPVWWQSVPPRAGGLQVVHVGSAAFRLAVVLIASGGFADGVSADQNIAVFDAGGRRVAGHWEVSSANLAMLVFTIAIPGRYQVQIGEQLSDRQGRALGTPLRGDIQVQ